MKISVYSAVASFKGILTKKTHWQALHSSHASDSSYVINFGTLVNTIRLN